MRADATVCVDRSGDGARGTAGGEFGSSAGSVRASSGRSSSGGSWGRSGAYQWCIQSHFFYASMD